MGCDNKRVGCDDSSRSKPVAARYIALAMFGLPPTTVSIITPILVSAWLFQAYWGVRTFADAKDDIKQGGKVSEWLYAGFVTPVANGGFIVVACLDMDFRSGDRKLTWSIHCLVAILSILWPSLLIIIGMRTYELCSAKY